MRQIAFLSDKTNCIPNLPWPWPFSGIAGYLSPWLIYVHFTVESPSVAENSLNIVSYRAPSILVQNIWLVVSSYFRTNLTDGEPNRGLYISPTSSFSQRQRRKQSVKMVSPHHLALETWYIRRGPLSSTFYTLELSEIQNKLFKLAQCM